MRWRGIQSGAPASRSFAKNDAAGSASVPTPSTQRLRVTGRPATCGSSRGAMRE